MDAAGKPLDFHPTRRFFATALARAGVEPEIRKLLMRPSTGDVTEDCYTDREIEQLHEAVCCRIELDGRPPLSSRSGGRRLLTRTMARTTIPFDEQAQD